VDVALQRGLLINCTQETVLRLLPPYNVQQSEMKEAIRKLDEVLGIPIAGSMAHTIYSCQTELPPARSGAGAWGMNRLSGSSAKPSMR
jgi:hypothetical protein